MTCFAFHVISPDVQQLQTSSRKQWVSQNLPNFAVVFETYCCTRSCENKYDVFILEVATLDL